jgi:pimeloyl-ACP methyl ester carboxylesterase
VPYVDSGGARIWYTEQGAGFPLLTLAPGGMRSSVPLWEAAAINPLTAYARQYQVIAMDQRNAGQSAGPLEAGDPWGAYAADQLAVMDQLGIDRFLVFGCCIGGPFILKLCELAPERVVAAVLEQPVGITAGNRELFDGIWKQWAEQLLSRRGDLGSEQVEAFATAMWARDFVVSVTRDQVRSFRTPMLVLPGVDQYHPTETGREIAALAPGAELLEPWKDPEHLAAATETVGRFLRDHTPDSPALTPR